MEDDVFGFWKFLIFPEATDLPSYQETLIKISQILRGSITDSKVVSLLEIVRLFFVNLGSLSEKQAEVASEKLENLLVSSAVSGTLKKKPEINFEGILKGKFPVHDLKKSQNYGKTLLILDSNLQVLI